MSGAGTLMIHRARLLQHAHALTAPLAKATATPRRFLHGVGRRIGRRGAFLALFGCAYIMIGFSYTSDRPTTAVYQSLRVAIKVMPLWCYGVLWMLGGLFAIVVGLSPKRDGYGFVAAIVLPTLWTLAYFVGWFNGDSARGWVSGLIYLLIASAVAVVSGMPNPTSLPQRLLR
jgi:hypothetical protein